MILSNSIKTFHKRKLSSIERTKSIGDIILAPVKILNGDGKKLQGMQKK